MSPSLIALLPPSETKRDGGSAAFRPLCGAEQDRLRDETVSALVALAQDAEAHQRALKLSDKLAESERQRNGALRSGPYMPALERYTGVLYDALDVRSLDSAGQAWAFERFFVQSALWGVIRGSDAIPAYRCSASTRLGGLAMKARWQKVTHAVLAEHEGVILDLRSKSYAELGPLPERDNVVTLEFVTCLSNGEVKQLNHFNKQGKGEFLRMLASAPDTVHRHLDEAQTAARVCALLGDLGVEIDMVAEREAVVIVEDPRTNR